MKASSELHAKYDHYYHDKTIKALLNYEGKPLLSLDQFVTFMGCLAPLLKACDVEPELKLIRQIQCRPFISNAPLLAMLTKPTLTMAELKVLAGEEGTDNYHKVMQLGFLIHNRAAPEEFGLPLLWELVHHMGLKNAATLPDILDILPGLTKRVVAIEAVKALGKESSTTPCLTELKTAQEIVLCRTLYQTSYPLDNNPVTLAKLFAEVDLEAADPFDPRPIVAKTQEYAAKLTQAIKDADDITLALDLAIRDLLYDWVDPGTHQTFFEVRARYLDHGAFSGLGEDALAWPQWRYQMAKWRRPPESLDHLTGYGPTTAAARSCLYGALEKSNEALATKLGMTELSQSVLDNHVMAAVMNGHVQVLADLLPCVSTQQLLVPVNEGDGTTLLHIAAISPHADKTLALLLAKGPEIIALLDERRSLDDKTPKDLAITLKNVAALEVIRVYRQPSRAISSPTRVVQENYQRALVARPGDVETIKRWLERPEPSNFHAILDMLIVQEVRRTSKERAQEETAYEQATTLYRRALDYQNDITKRQARDTMLACIILQLELLDKTKSAKEITGFRKQIKSVEVPSDQALTEMHTKLKALMDSKEAVEKPEQVEHLLTFRKRLHETVASGEDVAKLREEYQAPANLTVYIQMALYLKTLLQHTQESINIFAQAEITHRLVELCRIQCMHESEISAMAAGKTYIETLLYKCLTRQIGDIEVFESSLNNMVEELRDFYGVGEETSRQLVEFYDALVRAFNLWHDTSDANRLLAGRLVVALREYKQYLSSDEEMETERRALTIELALAGALRPVHHPQPLPDAEVGAVDFWDEFTQDEEEESHRRATAVLPRLADLVQAPARPASPIVAVAAAFRQAYDEVMASLRQLAVLPPHGRIVPITRAPPPAPASTLASMGMDSQWRPPRVSFAEQVKGEARLLDDSVQEQAL
jgi:hypothetical protein